MDKKTVFVFIEPEYHVSALCAKSVAGLEQGADKAGLSLHMVSGFQDPAQPGDPRAAIILSRRTDWTGYVIGKLRALGIKSVLVGTTPDEFGEDVSGPTFDRKKLVYNLMSYLVSSGRKRLACYGGDPLDYNDNTRRDAFLSAAAYHGLNAGERDVYMTDRGLDTCADSFLDRARDYDGAICVNDIAAVHLITRAADRGIRVPEDLFVAGSGDYVLGSLITPALTTTTLDYFQMGLLGIEIWRLLTDNPALDRAVLTLPASVISRASTSTAPVPARLLVRQDVSMNPDAPLDPIHHYLQNMENLLLKSDALDIGILSGLISAASIQGISSQLFISAGTVNYRLKKIYRAMDIADKNSLAAFLRQYLPNADMLDAMIRLKQVSLIQT